MPEQQTPQISENSSRIARNTIALYIRMLLLLIVGLFTARIVINALGVSDRGVYETVGSFVSMMAIITSSLSTAISRFLTVEIGKGNSENLRKIFATANAIMIFVGLAVILVAEPVGIWYIGNVMNIPDGRLAATHWVFQFSLATFVINLISVPYNAAIIAHERMSAFAVIGVVEGICKLAVALLIMSSSMDKLILYAMLMCCVALLVRFIYAAYCRHSFVESRAGVRLDRTYSKAMFGFAGWNGIAYGVFLLNTQGVTQLVNVFFGVVFNTMRGIGYNVENMVKQFVTNVVTAINPQITKSYTTGNLDYSFALVCKGAKYSFLIVLVLYLPFLFEADLLLKLWLGNIVPDGTALFTRLTLICMLLDIVMTTFSTLVQATGRIRKFYIVTSAVTFLIFPVTWILFRMGAPAYVMYLVFIAVYLVNDTLKLLMVRKQVGFPIRRFMNEVILKVLPVTLISLLLTFVVWKAIPAGLWRLLAVLAVGTLSAGLSTYFFALSKGEKAFVDSKIRKFL